jgi:hypothetical protein
MDHESKLMLARQAIDHAVTAVEPGRFYDQRYRIGTDDLGICIDEESGFLYGNPLCNEIAEYLMAALDAKYRRDPQELAAELYRRHRERG